MYVDITFTRNNKIASSWLLNASALFSNFLLIRTLKSGQRKWCSTSPAAASSPVTAPSPNTLVRSGEWSLPWRRSLPPMTKVLLPPPLNSPHPTQMNLLPLIKGHSVSFSIITCAWKSFPLIVIVLSMTTHLSMYYSFFGVVDDEWM